MKYFPRLPLFLLAVVLLQGFGLPINPAQAECTVLDCLPKNNVEDEADKPKAEVEYKLPPAPKEENLIAFDGGPATNNRFYLDKESLSVDSDSVVRYTLIIESAQGARNVSYEGIRCPTGEWRAYAYARTDGTWSPFKGEWKRIIARDRNRYHALLAQNYFCPGGVVVDNLGKLKQHLQYPDSKGEWWRNPYY